jgi:competence protein ComEC
LVVVAAATWAGAATGRWLGWPAVAALAGLAALVALLSGLGAEVAGWRRRRWLVAGALVAGALGGASGAAAVDAVEAVHGAPVPEGRVVMLARAGTDPIRSRFGWRQVVVPEALADVAGWRPWHGPPLSVDLPGRGAAVSGDRVRVEGRVVAEPGWVAGEPVAGVMGDAELVRVGGTASPLLALANRLRAAVLEDLTEAGPGRGLLAGFLVGDTSSVPAVDLDALRRAGLSHYVAVSGSNVAVFLTLWWLLLAPLAHRPRVRAMSGLVGVALFVLVTRAEPSVLRAGVMAGAVLGGRLLGVALDRWAALAVAVTGCLLAAGDLAVDVGFQLSVAATAGVMTGASLVRFEPQAVASVVGASVAAQVAVAPILLTAFGAVPALSPVANLVAAPLVSVATVLGGVGVLTGIDPLVWLAVRAAEAVLFVGRLAAPWPQLGWGSFLGLVVAGLVVWRAPSLRSPALAAAAVWVAVTVFPVGTGLDPGSVVFLDVGQGDSELVVGEGFTMLVDGGPDPVVLARKLDEYRVDAIDLLVVSHVHADHIEGLRAVVGRIQVGAAWTSFEGQATPASEWLTEALANAGVPTVAPVPGTRVAVDGLVIEVLGPLRRYASPNDQSIVLRVTVGGRTILFPGDAEVIAQGELGPLPVDVLKVPHQGAATSDPAWLAATTPEVAVVSVGANDFGHPAPWVIDLLRSTGAAVHRTDLDGDLILEPLTAYPGLWSVTSDDHSPQNDSG